jgi:ribonuclease HI
VVYAGENLFLNRSKAVPDLGKVATSNMAELYAAMRAIEVAKENHFRRVEIRIDCRIVIEYFRQTRAERLLEINEKSSWNGAQMIRCIYKLKDSVQ